MRRYPDFKLDGERLAKPKRPCRKCKQENNTSPVKHKPKSRTYGEMRAIRISKACKTVRKFCISKIPNVSKKSLQVRHRKNNRCYLGYRRNLGRDGSLVAFRLCSAVGTLRFLVRVPLLRACQTQPSSEREAHK